MSEVPSPNLYALRCPRSAHHVIFEGVLVMRVRRRVVINADAQPIDTIASLETDILVGPMDGPTPTCHTCGSEAMIGRPPVSIIDEEIPF